MSQPRSTVPRIGNYKSQKLWKLRRARNAPSTIVDAAPAQDHVCWLVSLGFNDSSIAAACELTQKTIANFRNRVYSNARAVQSARILAVSHVPCAAQHTRYVPSLGAQRRIRALLAIGWRYADIGAETGMLAEGVARIMRVTTILGRTWSAISHAYNKLSGTRGPSTQGAKKAVKRGFPPPLAWEGVDIDHPHAQPDWAAAGIKLADRPVCPNGHTYTPANTKRTADGRRACRTCRRTNDATAKRNARRRAAQAS